MTIINVQVLLGPDTTRDQILATLAREKDEGWTYYIEGVEVHDNERLAAAIVNGDDVTATLDTSIGE